MLNIQSYLVFITFHVLVTLKAQICWRSGPIIL